MFYLRSFFFSATSQQIHQSIKHVLTINILGVCFFVVALLCVTILFSGAFSIDYLEFLHGFPSIQCC